MAKQLDLIVSNWWGGTERQWECLPIDEREQIALAKTGCLYAWPRWHAPVDCCHGKCRVARGEIPQIALLNSVMRAETERGWWRFIQDRVMLAQMYRHYRAEARRTGEYDLWKLGASGVALLGVLGK